MVGCYARRRAEHRHPCRHVTLTAYYLLPIDIKLMSDLGPLGLSLRVASLATLLIVALGLPIALVLARTRFPGKGFVAGVLVLPLVLPPTVLGYYLLQVLGRRAVVGHWLEQTLGITIVFHWSGAVVASAVAAFPLFLLPARSAFESVDPALEEVARLLGRRELSVFLAVTLPLAWRGLAAGVVLAFARALGDFGATLMVAGNIPGLTQTAALAIYDAVQINDSARAGWLTLWISMVSILALVIVQRTLPSRGLTR
jgi:molybdate transport system permease protein